MSSEVNLDELRTVLIRRFRVPARTADDVDRFLRTYDVVPVPDQLPGIKIRDTDDLEILASAIAAGADVVVTRDKDLLEVTSESPVRIVSPRDFWKLVRRPRRKK